MVKFTQCKIARKVNSVHNQEDQKKSPRAKSQHGEVHKNEPSWTKLSWPGAEHKQIWRKKRNNPVYMNRPNLKSSRILKLVKRWTQDDDCSGALNPASLTNKIKELNGRQGSLNSYLDYLNSPKPWRFWFIRDISSVCKIHDFCIGGVHLEGCAIWYHIWYHVSMILPMISYALSCLWYHRHMIS